MQTSQSLFPTYLPVINMATADNAGSDASPPTPPRGAAANVMHLLNDPVYYKIVESRVKLLFDHPFFGTLAARMELIDASSWCNTAATDGRHFYYNRDFIMKLTQKQLLFLMGHEVLHCVYDHLGRRQGRDPKIWNMANDYIVNFTLVKEQCGEMPPQGLISKKYTDEFSSEEVYEMLIKDSVKIEMTLDMHLEPSDDGSGDGDDNDGDDQGGQKTVEVTVMGKDGPPKLTEADIEKIRNEMRAAAIQAAQAVGADRVPAGIRRMIQQLVTPKLDWRALLDAHIRSSVKDDFTYQRSSRVTAALRYVTEFNEDEDDVSIFDEEDSVEEEDDTGYKDPEIMFNVDDETDDDEERLLMSVPMLPAQDFMNTIKIAIAIDASGSETEEMLRDQLSETKGIMQTFADFVIDLWTFDTKTYNYKRFTPQNIDEIDTYPLDGGGGTLFPANWEHMKRHEILPERFVMFTDGLPNGNDWGEPNYCDTLFVIHGNTKIVAPFGITTYYEPKKKH